MLRLVLHGHMNDDGVLTMIQVAAGMMAGCLPAGSCAARIMLFAGGPPTVGSGKVVDMELTEPIRYTPRCTATLCCAGQHLACT